MFVVVVVDTAAGIFVKTAGINNRAVFILPRFWEGRGNSFGSPNDIITIIPDDGSDFVSRALGRVDPAEGNDEIKVSSN